MVFIGMHFYYINMIPNSISNSLGATGLIVTKLSGDSGVHNIQTARDGDDNFRLKIYLNKVENGNFVSLLKLRPDGVLASIGIV